MITIEDVRAWLDEKNVPYEVCMYAAFIHGYSDIKSVSRNRQINDFSGWNTNNPELVYLSNPPKGTTVSIVFPLSR